MADNDNTEELKQERGRLKEEEGRARRQKKIRQAQLTALKQAQKESGRAGKIAGGAAADVGTQAPILAGRAALEAGEKALDVATVGAYTPIDVATTIGGSAFQKGAGKTAKYAVGRPLGKQAGKAPFRPLIAMQKSRVSAAKKKESRAKGARRQIDKELAQDKRAPEKMLGFLIKGMVGIVIASFELVISLILAALLPILLLLLLLLLAIIITIFPVVAPLEFLSFFV